VVDAVLAWLVRLPAMPTYLVLMALSALENVFPPVPADVAVALGAFLAQRGEVHAPLLGIVCLLANTASSLAMYALGRAYGPEFFASGWRRKLLPPEVMRVVAESYERHGVGGIFVSRFLPGVRAAVTPFAGVVGLPLLRAMLPSAAASAIWYAFLIAAGSALGLSWAGVRRLVDEANTVLGTVGALAAAAFGLWLWRRVRVGRR
jgi:membrane protein DedA with SNARE-associated domain